MSFRLCFTLLFGMFLLAAGCGEQSREPAPANIGNAPLKDQTFQIAGSGSNLAITEKLAEAYQTKTGVRIHIPASIGSIGAINAVKAGTLELGMISRPLTDEERSWGLKELPYARVAAVFAVNSSVAENNLSSSDIIRILEGEKTAWSDGSKIFVHVREEKDSSNLILYDLIPGYKKVLFESYQHNRWRVLYRDSDMAKAVATTKGAFGLITSADAAQYKTEVKVMSLDSVDPSVANIHSGRYRAVKVLSFVYKERLTDRAKQFIAFVYSPDAQHLFEEWGGLPLEG